MNNERFVATEYLHITSNDQGDPFFGHAGPHANGIKLKLISLISKKETNLQSMNSIFCHHAQLFLLLWEVGNFKLSNIISVASLMGNRGLNFISYFCNCSPS